MIICVCMYVCIFVSVCICLCTCTSHMNLQHSFEDQSTTLGGGAHCPPCLWKRFLLLLLFTNWLAQWLPAVSPSRLTSCHRSTRTHTTSLFLCSGRCQPWFSHLVSKCITYWAMSTAIGTKPRTSFHCEVRRRKHSKQELSLQLHPSAFSWHKDYSSWLTVYEKVPVITAGKVSWFPFEFLICYLGVNSASNEDFWNLSS